MAAPPPVDGEAQTTQPPSDASSATFPRWVMLEKNLKIQVEGSSCSTSGASSKTLAAARTSTGLPIQISLRLTDPPGVSCVCLHLPAGHDPRYSYSSVVAAHGDSVLIGVQHNRQTTDHFVYSAGAAAADPPRPPTICLLPPFPLGRPSGLVRRGDDLVVVAYVMIIVLAAPEGSPPELMRKREADLCLFRSGEWSIKRVQVTFRDAASELPAKSYCDTVVPVGGDGLLCWFDQYRLGVLLCDDVFEETPRLRYLPLPGENIIGEESNRNVCATASGDALKFVNVYPRCCCGVAGASSCQRSCHAYTIETWTMRIGGISDDDMEWVKDAIVDSSELWALDSYKGLRRFALNHPVVSLGEPELISFWLHEPAPEVDMGDWRRFNDKTVDVLMVNMRSKTIHSVSRYEDGLAHRGDGALIPSNVSCFFNSDLGSGSDVITFTGQRMEDTERPRPVVIDDDEGLIREDDGGSNNPTELTSEIIEAFEEIPSYGLDHDDELKVYRILSRDKCRRFRSLLRLPKSLRKEWLLMEIRAGED